MNKADYHNAMNQLFSDKIEIIKNDPTLTTLKTVQNYLNNLCKRNEITEAEKKQMTPMSVQLGRTYGLPKIHKVFANIPNFRPIIDTTNTPYYKIGQYLSSLLQPLTINNYFLKYLNHQKYLKTEISLGHLILSFYSRMCLSIKPSILF